MLSRFVALPVSPILNASLLQLFNHSLYPSGGEGWVSKMGNISMTYYTNGFDSNNVHQKTHPMVNGGGGMEPHPNTSLTFYTDLFKYNQEHFNMEMLL